MISTNHSEANASTPASDSEEALKTDGSVNGNVNDNGETVTTAVKSSESETDGNYIMKMVAEKQSVDIIREDSDANRRLVYLKITNFDGTTHKGLTFTYQDGGETVSREIATIYLNNKVVYDTIWVLQSSQSIQGQLTDGSGNVLWAGTVTVQNADREYTIAKSEVYSLTEIQPLTLRGVNYYPRWTPWTAWTKQDESTWRSEFQEMSEKLNVNAIRTFAECWESDWKLGRCATPEYIETISKLFQVADDYGIKVLFCLHSGLPSQIQAENLRYVRSIMEPFINDGRVLGWDLINEVDAKGLSEVDYIDDFCLEFNQRMSQIDPNHLNSIGFAYMLDKPVSAGLTFTGSNQCWQYHYYRKFTTDTIAGIAKSYFGSTPFIIGECGDSSLEGVSDAPRPDTGEDWQLAVYQSIIPAVQGAKERGLDIKGVFAWTAFEFPNMLNTETGQGEYGLIREDGELKPAGAYLGAEFLKMKQSNPSQWD